MVFKNEEITIIREFQSRKEGLRYLQKLPLEHKIDLSKNLILNCIETFGDQQVYISFSGGKDSTVLSLSLIHIYFGCNNMVAFFFVVFFVVCHTFDNHIATFCGTTGEYNFFRFGMD